MRIRKIIVTLCLLVFSLVAKAEQGDTTIIRPVGSAFVMELGKARNIDTYLSPIRYTGYHIGIGYEHIRATRFNPYKWVNQLKVSLSYDHIENPVKNNTMHYLQADIDWRMMRRYKDIFTPGFDIFVGSNFNFDGGINYNARNSNNVCSPQINIGAGISAMAVYKFKIGKLPVTARYQPSVPVIGAYYLPDYDQSFYEIYLGNYKDAVNFGWWGNRFDMDNLITVDFHLGSAALRLGYKNEATTIWKNNISVRKCIHSFILGISWESIRFNPRKGMPKNAKYISALY